MSQKVKTIGVILAAGKGERMQSQKPKQFLELEDKPVLVHSFETFRDSPLIDQICVVAPIKGDVKEVFDLLLPYIPCDKYIQLVKGGDTRADSIYAAYLLFHDVKKSEDGKIEKFRFVIHDAARPLLSMRDLHSVIESLNVYPAVVLATRCRDTMYQVNELRDIVDIPSRDFLWHALTPQAFQFEVLEMMFNERPTNPSYTDDVSIMRATCPGIPIQIVEAQDPNPKLTTQQDWAWVNFLLQEREREQELKKIEP